MGPRTRWAIAAAIAAVLGAQAHAGRSCEVRKLSTEVVALGLDLAQRTQEALDASGAQVVMLARAGQDLTRYELRYSHMGFAYRDGASGGAWRVVHALNHCGSAESALYRQGLGEFFLDDPWRHETAWTVPTRELQERLLPVLQDDRRAAQMHEKHYNVVAYPWSRTYQQSNQWAIETLAAAAEPGAASRERAQAWLQFKGYQPTTTLRIGALTRLGGRLTAANVAFDDHPDEKRFSDRIETVTVDSVFQWMQRSGLGTAPSTLQSADPATWPQPSPSRTR